MKNVLLFLSAVLVSLILCEALVRLTVPQNLSGSWRELSQDKSYLLNKSSGISKHQFGERQVVYRFEFPHLRSTENEKKQCQKKVLILGDSFTFGWLLDAEQTYVSRLEKFFLGQGLDYCFYNAAAGGWGVADYSAFYEDFGNLIKPDLVLVFLNLDDISRAYQSNIYHLVDGDLVRVSLPNQALYLKQLMNSLPGYQWLLEHSQVFQLIRSVVLGISSRRIGNEETGKVGVNWSTRMGADLHSKEESDSAVTLAKSLFVRLNALANSRGSELLVVTTGWQVFAKDSGGTNPNAIFYQRAKEFFDSESIAFIDTTEEFSKLSNDSINDIVIPADQHPNEIGAELIFEASIMGISEFMKAHFQLVQK